MLLSSFIKPRRVVMGQAFMRPGEMRCFHTQGFIVPRRVRAVAILPGFVQNDTARS
jgi:hypothetical protein